MINDTDNKELTNEDFKKLVCEIAIKISPLLIKKKEGKDPENDIALYAYDIADAVRSVLKNRNNFKA